MLGCVFTLPIAQREMLVLAKSPTIYRTRITNSIGVLFLGAGFAVVYHYAGFRAVGQIVPVLTFILLLVSLFAGVHLTADSIAKEKREGTLGLLLLTHLTPFQIVMGKLIAHGLMGFYAIIIVVPLLSLIMIVGGVRGTDVLVVALAAFNTLFFSAAVGLFASSRHIERKKAGGAGTWVVVFFWWGIPVLVQVLNYFRFPAWTGQVLNLFAVNGMFNSVFAGPRLRILESPWLSMVCTHLLAWGFLGLATYFVRTRWQDHPAKPRFSTREWWKKLSIGNASRRLRLRETLLDRNPFLWLASRDRLRGFGLWVFTTVFLAFAVWQFRQASGFVAVVILAIVLGMAHKAMVGGASAQQLIAEQEQGTLEMLLSTPLKVETVIKGQFLATVRQIRGPVFLCLLMQAVAAVLLLFLGPGKEEQLGAFGMAANAGMYLFDLYAMMWAGMWGATIVKEAKNAPGAAMLRIIVLPALIFGLVVSMTAMADWYFTFGLDVEREVIIGSWFLLGIVNNTCWLIYIRKRLPQRLREYALRRYSPQEKKSWFARLWNKKKSSRPGLPPILGASSAGG